MKQLHQNIIPRATLTKKRKPYYLITILAIILLVLLWNGFTALTSFANSHEFRKNSVISMQFKWPLTISKKENKVQVVEKMPPPKDESANDKVIRLVREKFGDQADETLVLLQGESGLKDSATGHWTYRYWAVNQTSGACGLFQALPCEKMPCGLGPTDIECQIDWGKKYIEGRYGSSINAHESWAERLPHWY